VTVSKESIIKIRTKYTNNCTLLGELATQVHDIQKQMDALTAENSALNQQFRALSEAIAAAKKDAIEEAAAAKTKKEEADGTQGTV
jgi:regulator of replication initiation timing